MANQNKPESHAGFYVIMAALAVAIIGGGLWWFTANSADADKEQTAQLNQPAHPPKDAAKKPVAGATPTTAAPADNK